MNKRLLQLVAAIALLALSAGAYAIAPEGSWWSTSYGHRQRIDLPAGSATLNSGYAVSLVFNHATQVTAGRSLSSGDDVRIAYYNGTTWVELDRVLDPTTAWNTATTRLWFRTQASIASGVTNDNYYIYYGNAVPGTPPSNSSNVYTLYDEFDGTVLDAALWSSTGPSPVVLSGGILSCPNSCQLQSVASYGVNTIWEARVSLSSTTGSSFHYWLASDAGNFNGVYTGFYLTGSSTHTGVSDNGGTASTRSITATTANTYRNYAFTRESTTTIRFYVNGTQQGTNVTTNIAAGNLPVMVRNSAGPGTTQNYDWVRIRPYRTNEPTLTTAGREQFAVLAEYRFEETTWNGTAGEVADSSTSNMDGSSSGAVTANTSPVRTGNPGTCRYGNFDGTNDFVRIADNNELDITAAFTVGIWVYPRSYASELKSIVSKDTNFEFHLDDNGDVYWWWNDSTGTTRSLTSSGFTLPLNQWTHVAITYRSGSQRIYLNGVQRGSSTYTGALATNGLEMQIGYDGAGSSQPVRYWNGLLDEVNIYSTALSSAQVSTLMNATHACVGGLPHFVIGHDGYGINCAADTITVNVRDVANNPYAGYAEQITLDTGSGRGDWTLITGNGTLTNGTANDGIATYQWSALNTSATFALTYREGASPIDIEVYQTNTTTIRDDDTEGQMTWTPSGFTVTSSLLSNPPPGVIPAFASPQIAATSFTTHITAYGTTATDTQCGVIEAYTGARTLNFWFSYVNPTSGTRQVTIDSSNVTTTEGATAQSVTFTNGQATVTTNYSDAGQINIEMRDIASNPSLSGGIRGATGNIVVRPATFVLSNIRRTSDDFGNAAATDHNGGRFIAAGEAFSATVTALNSANVATPNFGHEIVPESVTLDPTLVLPAIGSNPAISSTVGFGAFDTNGVANGTDFSWSEVGIIRLTPRIRDGNYLGAGDVVGTVSGNVGRFVPANFVTGMNSPQFQAGCTAFTYVGQPFTYLIAPVVTVSARAVSGSVTANYTGNFFKLTNTSLTGRNYSATAGTINTGALPATSSDPTILDLTSGNASLTFGLPSGLSFTRSAPTAPFSPQISLAINVIDSDSVTASNPVTFSNIAFSTSSEQRYGRVAFRNSVGSELLNLPVTMRSEYFASAASGFVVSTADSCTTGVTATLTNFGGNLASGETCLIDSGSPGASGVGCPAAGIVGQRFSSPPTAGDFIAILRAPGAGNDGTVTISTVVPTWLQFNWNSTVLGDENPSGIATFGLFKGEAKRIYQTEK